MSWIYMDGCQYYNDDKTCNTCKNGYYKDNDNKYYEYGCSLSSYNSDETCSSSCNYGYYKGNDNICYKCIGLLIIVL